MSYLSEVTADSPLFGWDTTSVSASPLAPAFGAINLNMTNCTFGTGVVGNTIIGNGTTSFIQSAAALNLTAYSSIVFECIVKQTNYTATNQILAELGASGGATGGFYALLNDSVRSYMQLTAGGNIAVHSMNYVRPPVSVAYHLAIQFSPNTGSLLVYINGGLRNIAFAGTSGANTNKFNNAVLNLLARNGGASLFCAAAIEMPMIYSSLSAARIAVHAGAAGLGPCTPVIFTQSQLQNNGKNNISVAPKHNVFSALEFYTDASDIDIGVQTDAAAYNLAPALAQYGLVVNDVVQSPIVPPAAGSNILSRNIGSAGVTKKVKIIDGIASGASGQFLIDCNVRGNTKLPTLSPLSTARKIALYGDSIASGGNPTNPPTEGWESILIRTLRKNFVCESWGSRSLHDDVGVAGVFNSAKAITWANLFVPYAPSLVYVAIGTNDWGLNAWTVSVANFQTAVGSSLDQLHTTLPGVTFYVQTPIWRAADTSLSANSNGQTMAQFRTAMVTEINARSSFCILVDGLNILTAGSVTQYNGDQIHPTTIGMAAYAAYVNTVLPAEHQYPMLMAG